MTDNERKLINLLYSVEEYLIIEDDYFSSTNGRVKKPVIEKLWLNKRDKLIEEIKGENNE